MEKSLSFLKSNQFLHIVFAVFVIVFVLFDVSGIYHSRPQVTNQDNYIDMFKSFEQIGYYDSVVKGTSILYNLALSGIYCGTNSIPASFFVLNALSDLALLLIGWRFCVKMGNKSNLSYMLAIAYALQILSLRSYLRASNDTFLGVFVVLSLYFMVLKIYKRNNAIQTFAWLGLFIGICLCIRVTAIFLIPLLLISLVCWYQKNGDISRRKRILLPVVSAAISLLIIGLLHYPSLAENRRLSYENKDPGNGITWIQRNYLGLKKIENGKEKWHRDAIWKRTPFSEVSGYLAAHGNNSIPGSFSEVIMENPILVGKIAIYNVLSCLGRFIRFWGVLFFIPLVSVFRRTLIARRSLPTLLLAAYTFCICFTCFSFVEFRWFFGYEILIPVGILAYFTKSPYFSHAPKRNAVVALSFLLITIFNLKAVVFR